MPRSPDMIEGFDLGFEAGRTAERDNCRYCKACRQHRADGRKARAALGEPVELADVIDLRTYRNERILRENERSGQRSRRLSR